MDQIRPVRTPYHLQQGQEVEPRRLVTTIRTIRREVGCLLLWKTQNYIMIRALWSRFGATVPYLFSCSSVALQVIRVISSAGGITNKTSTSQALVNNMSGTASRSLDDREIKKAEDNAKTVRRP